MQKKTDCGAPKSSSGVGDQRMEGCSSDDGSTSTGLYLSPNFSSGPSLTLSSAISASDVSDQEVGYPHKACGKTRAPSVPLHESVALTPSQREALECVVDPLDTDSASVVITNPLAHDNPIIFVTQPWEEMCGFSYSQAVGRNARITQGQHSDRNVMRLIGSAMRQQRSCKVLTLNYRGGIESRPFWNMLSISPIHHRGQLVLYLANLQDYTYHMSKLVSLPPTQFCRSAQHHQRMVRMTQDVRPGDQLDVRFFARPGIIETSDTRAAGHDATTDDAKPQFEMKVGPWPPTTPWAPAPLTPVRVALAHLTALALSRGALFIWGCSASAGPT